MRGEKEPAIWCHNCQFFAVIHDECRRNPPRIVLSRNPADEPYDHDGVWPGVSALDWCGEYAQSGEEPEEGWRYE